MSFVQLTSSAARHSAGFEVHLKHALLRYTEAGQSLTVPVESLKTARGFRALIYDEDICQWDEPPNSAPFRTDERLRILSNIREALSFLKIDFAFSSQT